MTGEVSGYYEPERIEQTALEELQDKVIWCGQPDTFNGAEWQRVFRISRVTPFTDDDLADLARTAL